MRLATGRHHVQLTLLSGYVTYKCSNAKER